MAAGCPGSRAESADGGGRAIRLSASLVSPIDVVLRWEDPDPAAAGHVVEYSMAAQGHYVPLSFLPPGVAQYRHPRLMPRTRFFYRVRAIYGPASAPFAAALPPLLSDAEYLAAFNAPQDFSWAPPRFNPTRAARVLASVRNPATAAAAAPANLTGTFITSTASGFQLAWIDRAKDPDGYVLECEHAGGSEFRVCALMPPHTNTFGWELMPPERKALFRVRPFYYGPASNIVSQMTGDRPSQPPRT